MYVSGSLQAPADVTPAKFPSMHWVGLRFVPNVLESVSILFLAANPERSSLEPSQFTDWANPTYNMTSVRNTTTFNSYLSDLTLFFPVHQYWCHSLIVYSTIVVFSKIFG